MLRDDEDGGGEREIYYRHCIVFANVGLNPSTAINLFVKAVLRERRIPFEIQQSPDPFFSERNLAYVQKSVQELHDGKGTAHELIEVDDE
ncbi:MAG TPA: type II toxin-antitoxin system RelB/DinJ family antitoxin [Candidatus Mediterraneibacter intestinavium]|nr:type II toxin-antitoxin system RelB/DinJ family antitoxin [Candidatus Mediterraneibacter intestinavium]